MKRWVVLISGRGSNMAALLRAHQAQHWPWALAGVIANRPDAAGLAFAQAQGVPTAVVDHRAHPDRSTFEAALRARIEALCGGPPDLVVLAGFMRVLTPEFTQHFAGRLLNIHPSLLPAFPGLHTHERALAAGCQVAGATVHAVTAELDHGPILAQAVVPIAPGDTPERLAQRVLALEHRMLPECVRWFLQDELVFEGERVRHRGGASQLFMAP